MEFRLTRHQVARGARADVESGDTMQLVKNVSSLRATYQIRLLTFRAMDQKMNLVIHVPRHCRIEPSLRDLEKKAGRRLQIVRMD